VGTVTVGVLSGGLAFKVAGLAGFGTVSSSMFGGAVAGATEYGTWVIGSNVGSLAYGRNDGASFEITELAMHTAGGAVGGILGYFGAKGLSAVGRNALQRVAGAPNSVASGGWHKATGGKWISLDDAGGAIRPLSNDKIKFTDLGIDYLEDHLSRFKSPSGGMWDHNAAMINDLRKIARGVLEATQIHRNFYSHELREMTRLRRLGSTFGPVDPFDYANTHYATLFEYGIPWGEHGSYLYTRFARTFFPGGY
jgi:hypothetical protein